MTVYESTFDDRAAPAATDAPEEKYVNYFHPAFIPLVLFLLGWWVYSVIWVALRGIDGGYISLTTYFGQPARLNEEDLWVLWALLTGLKEGTQLVIHFCWRWFTKSWERVILGLLVLLIAFLFVVVDIAITSTGWYVRVKPLDLHSVDWLLASGSTVAGAFGAVFAQAIGLHIAHKWWEELRPRRKEDQNVYNHE